MILLDTQVILWWLSDDQRLGPRSRSRLADRSERIRVSPVSVFEVETKRRLGELRAPGDLLTALDDEGFEWLELDAAQASLAGTRDWRHRDPFDRLLVAQARRSGIAVMTADARILADEPTAFDARE